jgi:1,2-phenylacetyl-CoA epoxidase catalytic subunit
MSQQDETNTLLREIRDLVSQREQYYKNHLANLEQAYAEQTEKAQQRAQRQAINGWIIQFAVMFAAVYLALMLSK